MPSYICTFYSLSPGSRVRTPQFLGVAKELPVLEDQFWIWGPSQTFEDNCRRVNTSPVDRLLTSKNENGEDVYDLITCSGNHYRVEVHEVADEELRTNVYPVEVRCQINRLLADYEKRRAAKEQAATLLESELRKMA